MQQYQQWVDDTTYKRSVQEVINAILREIFDILREQDATGETGPDHIVIRVKVPKEFADLPRGTGYKVMVEFSSPDFTKVCIGESIKVISRPAVSEMAAGIRDDAIGAAYVLGQRIGYDNIFGEDPKESDEA